MKKNLLLCFMMLCSVFSFAQEMAKGSFLDEKKLIRMEINLEACDVPVPGLEMEYCYGYIQGNINGTWAILKVKKLDDKMALVRAVCDRGDVAQDIELTFTENGFTMKQVGDSYIKGIENRKYVKLPKVVSFIKQK